MERALCILFLHLGVTNGVKIPYKKEIHKPENEACVRRRCLFLPYFFEIKLRC